MPKIPVVANLQGDIPPDAQNILEIARELGITKSIIQRLIRDEEIQSWVYLGRYVFCYKQEILLALRGRRNDQKNEGNDDTDGGNSEVSPE